jgi:hypothetical protein
MHSASGNCCSRNENNTLIESDAQKKRKEEKLKRKEEKLNKGKKASAKRLSSARRMKWRVSHQARGLVAVAAEGAVEERQRAEEAAEERQRAPDAQSCEEAQTCEEAGPCSMASVAGFAVITAIPGRQQGADES